MHFLLRTMNNQSTPQSDHQTNLLLNIRTISLYNVINVNSKRYIQTERSSTTKNMGDLKQCSILSNKYWWWWERSPVNSIKIE